MIECPKNVDSCYFMIMAKDKETDKTTLQKQLQEILETYPENWDFCRPNHTKILDYLYVGGYDDADNFAKLNCQGFTHLLNCATVPNHRDKALYKSLREEFQYKQLDAEDSEKYDMGKHFKEAIDFIEQCRKSNGKVLVYCKRGMNRSVTITVAYLIHSEGYTLQDAVKMVNELRKNVLTNESFQGQLIDFKHHLDSGKCNEN